MAALPPSPTARPPLWLALETSGRAGSVALARGPLGEDRLAEVDIPPQRRHNVELFPVLDRLFRDHGLAAMDVTHIAVSAGPGSFTALRVGIVAARTLAQATGARLLAVPTLEALAQTLARRGGAEPHVVALFDAKRGHVLAQGFGREASAPAPRPGSGTAPCARVFAPLVPAAEYDPADLLARLPRPLVAIGEGAAHHAAALAAAGVPLSDPPTDRPSAAAVLDLAADRLARDGERAFSNLHALEPIYIRPPEAEEKWQARQAAGAASAPASAPRLG